MNTSRWLLMLLTSALLWACTTPPVPSPSPGPAGTSTPATPAPIAGIIQPTATLALLPTLAPATAPPVCTPQVTANTMVNVRNGPGAVYSIIGSLNEGQVATVAGKNAEGTWWYILLPSVPDGHGWVADSVTTSDCISLSLPVIPTSSLPAPFVAAIINVVVSVDPGEVNVPGCVGEAQRMTAAATIYASGPMQVQYYFEIDGGGTTKTRTLTFTKYGSQDVSESFRPEVVEGKHTVRLWIDGLDVRGMQDSARYTITCQ